LELLGLVAANAAGMRRVSFSILQAQKNCLAALLGRQGKLCGLQTWIYHNFSDFLVLVNLEQLARGDSGSPRTLNRTWERHALSVRNFRAGAPCPESKKFPKKRSLATLFEWQGQTLCSSILT
jgi:hypothetical protein